MRVPEDVMEVHSKRESEIEVECKRRGGTSYRARGVAARTTRKAKRHVADGQLAERWRAELASVGWPAERLSGAIAAAAAKARPKPMTYEEAHRLIAEVLSPDGELAHRKVLSRRHVVVVLAPHLYGEDPKLLGPLVGLVLSDPEAVPIIGVKGAKIRWTQTVMA